MASSSTSSSNSGLLEKYFYVYDPHTQRRHTNFSSLDKARVILMGEYHYSANIWDIQRRCLEQYARATNALLVEAVHPSVELTPDEHFLTRAIDQSFVLEGWDARSVKDKKANLHVWQVVEQSGRYRAEAREAERAAIQELGSYLKECQQSTGLRVFQGDIIVTAQQMEQIDKLSDWKVPAAKETSANSPEAEEASQEEDKSAGSFDRSNQSLLAKALSVSVKVERVFAVVGLAHLLLDNGDLYEGLEKKGVDYLALIPNEACHRLVKEDHNMMAGRGKRYQLSFATNGRRISFGVSKSCLPYLPPIVQDVARARADREKVRKLHLTAESLQMIAGQSDTFTFPKGMCLTMSRVNRADVREFYDDIDKGTFEFAALARILDNLLLPVQRMVSDLNGSITMSVVYPKASPGLKVKLGTDLTVSLDQNRVAASASYFLRQVYTSAGQQFRLQADKKLILYGLSEQQRIVVAREPNQLTRVLSELAPVGAQVTVISKEGSTLDFTLYNNEPSISLRANNAGEELVIVVQ